MGQKMAYKGFFKPRNREKYKGDPTKIIYRSGWELKLMQYLDHHSDVVEWQSEGVAIPYRSVIDNRMHRYFPDFIVKFRDAQGKEKTVMIEVKPHGQTQPPKPVKNKKTKKYINEVITYGVNLSKWQAAEKYCKDRNWEFTLMTEEHEPSWKM